MTAQLILAAAFVVAPLSVALLIARWLFDRRLKREERRPGYVDLRRPRL